MGSNSHGKLGIGSKHVTHSKSPQLIEALLGPLVTQVSCGDHHSAVITSSGECYTWGSGTAGALGLNYKPEFESSPVLVKELQHTILMKVSCGSKHTLYISQFKEVFATGDGTHGQLGLGSLKSQKTPKLISFGGLSQP
jgi:alpha-tubulin suppressor-like RCC1 family protein